MGVKFTFTFLSSFLNLLFLRNLRRLMHDTFLKVIIIHTLRFYRRHTDKHSFIYTYIYMVTDVPFCKLTCFLSPQLGIYMHPVFSTEGNYPQTVIDRVQAQSSVQGLAASRLRPFTQEQIDYIRGTADFLGLNHYTSAYAYRNSSIIGTFVSPSHNEDAFVGTYMSESWPVSAISAFHRVIFILFFSNIVKSKIV